MKPNKDFIRKLKEDSGLTTKRFAEIGGIKANTFSVILNSKDKDFSARNILNWALYFELNLKDFF